MAIYIYRKHIDNKRLLKMKKQALLFAHGKTKGRILILDFVLNDTKFLLINSYNSYSEPDQICTLSTLQRLLEKIDDFNNENIFGRVLNF